MVKMVRYMVEVVIGMVKIVSKILEIVRYMVRYSKGYDGSVKIYGGR